MDFPKDTCHFWYKSRRIMISYWPGNPKTRQVPRHTAAKILNGPQNDTPIHKLLREGLSYAQRHISNNWYRQHLVGHLENSTELRKRNAIPNYMAGFWKLLGNSDPQDPGDLEDRMFKIGYGVMEHPDDLCEMSLSSGLETFWSHVGDDSEKLLSDTVIFNKDLLESCVAPPYVTGDRRGQSCVPIVVGLLHGWAQFLYRDWQYHWNDTRPRNMWDTTKICHNARLFADGYLEKLWRGLPGPVAFYQVPRPPLGFDANHPAGYPVQLCNVNGILNFFPLVHGLVANLLGRDLVDDGDEIYAFIPVQGPILYVQKHVVQPPGIARHLLNSLPPANEWVDLTIYNDQQAQRVPAPANPPSPERQHSFPFRAQQRINETRAPGRATQPNNGQQPGHAGVKKRPRGRPPKKDKLKEQAIERRTPAEERPLRPRPQVHLSPSEEPPELPREVDQQLMAPSLAFNYNRFPQAPHMPLPPEQVYFQQPVHHDPFILPPQHVPQPHHHMQQQPVMPWQQAEAPLWFGPGTQQPGFQQPGAQEPGVPEPGVQGPEDCPPL
ncbi:hypothetical protein GGR57DRAFT_503374 [Xylariaceae sp. FL1272]|nr:hypothetical protein GGR57DRAFT_503374 [Xylariaceae sp. FL1272]